MSALPTLSQSMNGVVALARGQEHWAAWFDFSPLGVKASFRALILSLPALALIAECSRRNLLEAGSNAPLVSAPVGVYAITGVGIWIATWLCVIAVLIGVARATDAAARIPAVIVAQNWSSFLSYLIAAFTLGLQTLLPLGGLSALAPLLAVAVAFWLDWGVLRRALGIDPMGAVGIIVMIQAIHMLLSASLMTLIAGLMGF